MSKPKPFIAESKKTEVKEIQKLMQEYPIIGVVNMESLPAPQLQRMRKQLKGTVVIKMSKGRLIKVAITGLKDKVKGLDQLTAHIKGMPALIFTKDNPFKLAKTLDKNKSNAPAKPGQTAPNDITIPAGPTSFPPGPIISELGGIGIKTGIEDGKVAVKEDALVVSEGEVINQKVADVLSKMGIEPMEVGLNLTAVLEDGIIFTKKVLSVDEKEYIKKLQTAVSETLSLTMSLGFPTSDNIKMLLAKANTEVEGLAESIDFPTTGKVKKQLAKAEAEEKAIEGKVNLDTASKEEKPEEKPEEAKKESKKEAPIEEAKTKEE